MTVTVVIPARLAASRFPRKPLVSIAGLPMIEHVRRRAALAGGVDAVVVATCDEEIRDVVESYGGLVVMTSHKHERCTDRVAEAASSVGGDVVVTVQGDEPLLIPRSITQAAKPLLDGVPADCVSLLSELESADDFTNPNIVKAVCRISMDVMYFSRAHVPHPFKSGKPPVFRESGIRAMRSAFLQKYSTLCETELERFEAIDMLRVLDHGYRIHGALTEDLTMGVDHPEDVAIVERILLEDAEQQALLKSIL